MNPDWPPGLGEPRPGSVLAGLLASRDAGAASGPPSADALPGARDGVLTHHHRPAPPDPDRVAGIVDRIEAASGDAAPGEALDALGDALGRVRAVVFADAVIAEVARRGTVSRSGLAAVARRLLLGAHDPEVVRSALALLGISGSAEDVSWLRPFARDDEYALFALVALGRLSPDPAAEWLDAARVLRGWGRIHAVERLAARFAHRPEVRRFLLTAACENAVLPEYLGLACAQGGDLAAALAEASPGDDALFRGTGEVLAALQGGPVAGIEAYPSGQAACEGYVAFSRARADAGVPPSLADYGPLALVGRWCREDRPRGWDADRAERLGAEVDALLSPFRWRAAALEALASGDGAGVEHALAVARSLGGTRGGAGLAADLLAASCRGLVAQPGRGVPALAAALLHPSPAVRGAALSTLEAWPPEALGPEALAAVEGAWPGLTEPERERALAALSRDT
ncbi:hypothetical protein L6R50_07930 [Myxococcota bacterium]|nr:hypothetical protein [Myxococcota bacterium]